jgi:ADP-ribose pyrophosphatase
VNSSNENVTDTFGQRPVASRTSRHRGGKWELVTDRVELSADESVLRDVVVHPGAVGVLALDDHERVVLIQQYRHPVAATLWELPAGLLDDNLNDPWATAQRELFEEAHLRATEWHVLLDLFSSPGMSSELIRIYLARNLTEVPTSERFEQTEEERDMRSIRMPLDEVCEAALAGHIHNAMAVAGVLAAQLSRARGWRSLQPPDSAWLNDQSVKGF